MSQNHPTQLFLDLQARQEMLRRHVCGRPSYIVFHRRKLDGAMVPKERCTHCEAVHAAIKGGMDRTRGIGVRGQRQSTRHFREGDGPQAAEVLRLPGTGLLASALGLLARLGRRFGGQK